MDKRIGITSTIPVEVIYAAGLVPVDLNNLLVSARRPMAYIARAEQEGMPRNVCAWTKGIYEIARTHGIQRIVGVVEGDCSNTKAIMERWQMEGFEVIPFAYPYDRSRARMKREIALFAERLGASPARVEKVKKRLDRIRERVHILDWLTWQEGMVSGEENHLWQVSCSDFWGSPERFQRELERFLKKIVRREKREKGIRIGYAGVPPMVKGFYRELHNMGFIVVYNEIQRQFSMPAAGRDMVEQYLNYTYPYDIAARLADIKAETRKRELRGIVHYVQSFCHRGIEDYLVHREVGVPVLTLECDHPGPLDARSRVRLEAFGEMLSTAVKR